MGAVEKATTAFTQINTNFQYLDSALAGKVNMAMATNQSVLTPTNGEIVWNVSHNLNTQNIICILYMGSNEVTKDVEIISNSLIQITFKAATNKQIGTMKLVIIGV